ncbi:MAG: type II secretion system protein GspG [Planctomycetota bacterium]|nr:type II secretion system protein GspG [Planctomycetota bacterium]
MRLAKRWVCVLALAALFVGVPMGYAEPRDSWSLEARVPSSAMAMVSIEDVGGMTAKFEKTAIAGLFREPEMQAFFKPIEEAIEQLLESERGSPFGEATPMIMKLLEQMGHLRGQIAVAVVDFDPSQGMPQIAMSMDFGQHVGEFAQFLDGMRKEIDPQGNAITSFSKDGRTWWQVQDGPPITATTVDTAFVVATDPTLLEGVLAGAGESSMAASVDFSSVRTRCGGDQLAVYAYANVPAIIDTFGAEMPDEVRRIANALGLDTVRAAAYGMAFSGDGFMDSFILHAPDASHGIVPLVTMPPYQPRGLARVPANAFYYEEGAVNFDQVIPNIRKLVGSIESNAVEEMDGFLKQMTSHLGVDLEKDILGGLAGGACTYAALPETGGLFPELAIMLQVKEPAVYEQTFAKLAMGIAGAVSEEGDVIASTRKLDYRGQTLHLFEMQASRGDDVVPFTPTWTMLDDWLVITLVPHTMKEIVLRGAMTSGGGLAEQEDFRSLRRVMPEGAGELAYLDLQAIMSLAYDTLVPVLQTAVKPNVLGREVPFKLDWAQLPAARTVRPYFRSVGAYTTWNKDGFAVQMHGPIPLAGLLMTAAAIAVPAMTFGGMRESSVRMRRPVPRMPRVEPKEPGKPAIGLGGGPAKPSQLRMARIQAEQISSYVRVFLLTQQRLPKSLDELVKENVASSLPKDPWGHAFKLFVIDEKNRKFVVRSAGPDGSFGTKDDVQSSD